MSELADVLRGMIVQEGPITVERFMALALGHPTLGYYGTRDPLGASGDFTTAPEISQMFGELIGLWAAEAWAACGGDGPAMLIELGPGRGTLMADALRALRVAPDFLRGLEVHLVETSPALTARQRETLKGCGQPVRWHETLETLPEGPAVILANEFFDALPIRQYVRSKGAWRERLVGLGADGAFTFGLSAEPEAALGVAAGEGAVIEAGVVAQRLMGTLAARIARQGGALLAIDYGHAKTGFGDTLQAVRWHRFVDPLDAPGEADLTAHVDFGALGRAARDAGAGAQGPVTQKFFLEQIGIRQRAAALAARAAPHEAQRIGSALNRLTAAEAPTDMGVLFKVLAVAPAGATPLPGLVEIAP